MVKDEGNILDFEFVQKGFNKVKIGELTQNVIDLLGLDRNPCNIVMWSERFKYTQKHKINFNTEEEYNEAIENIPNIIKNPDYIGLHPTDNSIQYIKQINRLMLVGIRIRPYGEMSYRTAYPITESQLKDYIRKGRVKKVNNIK